MNHWQRIGPLLELSPSQRDHYPALRIALGSSVPLLLLSLAGAPQLSIFAIVGAFTGVYGRHEPWRERLKHQCYGAVLLLTGTAIGLVLAGDQAAHWEAVALVVLLASALSILTLWRGIRPAGAVFFTLAVSAISQVQPLSPLLGMSVTAFTVLWCLFLGVVGAFYSRLVRPEELQPHPQPNYSTAELLRFGGRHAVVLSAAGALSLMLGAPHFEWALTSAAAIVGVVGHRVRLRRSGQRVMGTMAGLGIAAFFLVLPFPGWFRLVTAVVLQFLGEMYIARNYALGLLFITPLALLMAYIARPVDVTTLLETRLLETVVGSFCGLLGVILLPAPED